MRVTNDSLCGFYIYFQIGKRRDKLLNYMLFLRITPTLPNLFINLASPIVDVPFHIFFLATLVGLIPAAYITVRVSKPLVQHLVSFLLLASKQSFKFLVPLYCRLDLLLEISNR